MAFLLSIVTCNLGDNALEISPKSFPEDWVLYSPHNWAHNDAYNYVVTFHIKFFKL